MSRLIVLRLLVLMLFGTVFSLEADGITGNFIIFDVPGATATALNAVNDSGQIGGYYYYSDLLPHGLLLTSGSLTTIDVPGSLFTAISGINNAGQVVGGYGSTGPNHGFVYNGSSFSFIDFPGASSSGTVALGINDAGQVVGEYGQSGVPTAFLADGSNFATIIPPSSVNCGTASSANGINDSGTIVGTCSNLSSFILSGGNFSTFEFPGAFSTNAYGINNDATIVGSYQLAQSEQSNGFVYQGGNFQTIDVPGAQATYVMGINDYDDLVGTFVDSSGVQHGFELIATPEPSSLAFLPVALLVAAALKRGRPTSE